MSDTLKGELVASTGQQPLPESDNSDPESAGPALASSEGDADQPKRGTVAWLQAQGTVEFDGVAVPTCHRIPEGAELAQPSEDSHCRVVIKGERCKGTRLLAFGLCMGHAGGGGMGDLDEMRRLSSEKRASLKILRQTLHIGGSRAADPRVAARLRAAQRANEIATAIVDGPLDDRKLGTVERQTAVLKALDATFPLQTTTVELSLSDPDSLAWHDLEQLAISLES